MVNEQTSPLTKKELNEQRRIEKQKERENQIRMKKIKSHIPWITLILVLVGGIYWVSTTVEKSNESRPGEAVTIMGEEHISVGQDHEPYNSNPPTSGPHAGPAPWGISSEEIMDENAIHNLEHGGIWISYKNLDAESIARLEKIAQKNSRSVILSPRENNDSNIAVASWGRLMKLDAVDEERINEFIQKNKNRSPERLAI